MHLLKAMEYLGYKKGDMPVCEKISGIIFALPMHPYMDEETIRKIAAIVKNTVEE